MVDVLSGIHSEMAFFMKHWQSSSSCSTMTVKSLGRAPLSHGAIRPAKLCIPSTPPPLSASLPTSALVATFQVIAQFVGAVVAGVLAVRALSSDAARGPMFLVILFAVGCLGWSTSS